MVVMQGCLNQARARPLLRFPRRLVPRGRRCRRPSLPLLLLLLLRLHRGSPAARLSAFRLRVRRGTARRAHPVNPSSASALARSIRPPDEQSHTPAGNAFSIASTSTASSSLFLMLCSVRRTFVVRRGSRMLTADRRRLRLCSMSVWIWPASCTSALTSLGSVAVGVAVSAAIFVSSGIVVVGLERVRDGWMTRLRAWPWDSLSPRRRHPATARKTAQVTGMVTEHMRACMCSTKQHL